MQNTNSFLYQWFFFFFWLYKTSKSVTTIFKSKDPGKIKLKMCVTLTTDDEENIQKYESTNRCKEAFYFTLFFNF